MRITEVETIAFNIPAETTPTRWGYSVWGGPPHETTMRILRLGTDEGAEGFSVGGMDIQAFDQDHGYTRTLGYRFGNFTYSTDLLGLPEESFQALEGVKTWIVEVFSWQPHRTHAHVDLALEWIKRVKPARSVLTHLGPTIDYAELSAYVPEGVEVAYDGMVIEVVDDDNG